MKKLKLHQWLLFPVLPLVIFTACSKKNYPASNSVENAEKYEGKNAVAANYTPPQVILIPDQVAHINKEGEMYYDDDYGYRYWRSADGKYYLDSKYKTIIPSNK